MTDYIRLGGSTSVSIDLFIFDPATGAADTTVVHNTSGLTLNYRRDGEASNSFTPVSLAALTTAWTDRGFLHIGNGNYRVDLPNASVAAGVATVLVHGALTSRSIIPAHVHLVSYDPSDAIRLGLSALPNVASGSAGAIPTTGTGSNQISVTSGRVILGTTAETKIAALPSATAGGVGGLALYDNVNSIAKIGSVNDASASSSNFDGNVGLEDTSNTKYVGAFLVFPQGTTLHPEARKISAYTASTRTFQFNGTGDDADRPFSAAPANGDPFFIVGIHGT